MSITNADIDAVMKGRRKYIRIGSRVTPGFFLRGQGRTGTVVSVQRMDSDGAYLMTVLWDDSDTAQPNVHKDDVTLSET